MRRLLFLLPLLFAATYETEDSHPYPHRAFSEKELVKAIKKGMNAKGIETVLLRNSSGDVVVDKLSELPRAALSARMRVNGFEKPQGTGGS